MNILKYEFEKQDQWDSFFKQWDKGAYNRLILIGQDYGATVNEFWKLHRLMSSTTSMIDWLKYSNRASEIQNELTQRCNMIVYQILNTHK